MQTGTEHGDANTRQALSTSSTSAVPVHKVAVVASQAILAMRVSVAHALQWAALPAGTARRSTPSSFEHRARARPLAARRGSFIVRSAVRVLILVIMHDECGVAVPGRWIARRARWTVVMAPMLVPTRSHKTPRCSGMREYYAHSDSTIVHWATRRWRRDCCASYSAPAGIWNQHTHKRGHTAESEESPRRQRITSTYDAWASLPLLGTTMGAYPQKESRVRKTLALAAVRAIADGETKQKRAALCRQCGLALVMLGCPRRESAQANMCAQIGCRQSY